MSRATLDPADAFGCHPLKPLQLAERVMRTEDRSCSATSECNRAEATCE